MTRKYDPFRKIPESPCECGKGCGLTFRRTIGQRGRKYHEDCPNRPRYHGGHKTNRTHEGPRQLMRSAMEGRIKRDVCMLCYDLPHARQQPACPKCLRPAQDTPSLPNHSTLVNLREHQASEE